MHAADVFKFFLLCLKELSISKVPEQRGNNSKKRQAFIFQHPGFAPPRSNSKRGLTK